MGLFRNKSKESQAVVQQTQSAVNQVKGSTPKPPVVKVVAPAPATPRIKLPNFGPAPSPKPVEDPATQYINNVDQAGREETRRRKRRYGLARTVYAGPTGGYKAPGSKDTLG